MELHPLCTLFPRMAGAEFVALVADIKANGQREPIIIHDGLILDGGNRFRACLAAGVEPETMMFGGGNLVDYVLSVNLHRRHLSPGQQAAIVASAQDWATAQSVGRPSLEMVQDCTISTSADRADKSGASVRTQKMADKVAKESPDLAKQVGRGEKTLPQAVEELTGKRPGAKKTISPIIPVSVDCAANEYELQEAQDAIKELVDENNTLKDRLAVENMDAGDEGKLEAATIISDLREQVRKMTLEIEAITKSRNAYQIENSELKKQLKRMQKAK